VRILMTETCGSLAGARLGAREAADYKVRANSFKTWVSRLAFQELGLDDRT
jgi:hypothetical protein